MENTGNALIKPKILHRGHIKKKLEMIFNRPLFFVISKMGFGKTTAVRDFLRKKKKIKYIWFSFEREDTEDIWLWVRFCRTIEKTNAQLGKKLFEYGMPHSEADIDRLVNAISAEIELETVAVFDDVHLCKSEYVQDIIKKLALAGIHRLHVVLISREYPMMKVDELVSTKKAGIMTQKNFEFSKVESEDFFILNDAPLSEAEIDVLYKKTKGWASGLYLALMHYLKVGSFDTMQSGNALMKSAIYDRFDAGTQQSLLVLSKLDTFTLDQAVFITQNRGIRDTIKRLYEYNCFTKYDEESANYSFHALLRALLDEEFEKSGIDPIEIFERQGEWNLVTGNRIGAIWAFSKCGEHDRVLEIMSERYASSLMASAPRVIMKAFDAMDIQTRYSNPIGYLTYIYSYMTYIDVKKGAKLLEEAKSYYQSVRNLDNAKQIFGEIALIESISAFNDLKKMFKCYEKAHEYFDGGTSLIYNSNVIITFGVPLSMFLYHKEPGDVKELLELIEEEFWIFNHIANGCGAGYENLMRAEYEYMTGNFERAEMMAYKAIYKAKTKDQTSIILSASFLLLRIAIFSGRIREIDEIMLQMMQEVEKDNNPALLGCYEFILGYVYAYMGKTELVPQWLIDGDITNARLMAPGRDAGYLIFGKIISEIGDYEKLEARSRELIDLYKEKRYITGVIISKVYYAIALYHNRGMDAAVEVMREALELSEPDDCYISIAENTYEIISMLEAIDTPYAKKTLEAARVYVGAKRLYKDEMKHAFLTKREREVMELVCDGYTAEAIAKILFVSHSTIKKHIAAAYDKLGVNKKADAIAAYRKQIG